jgi:FKBP-type peptidyl-prolyl cis-trans isomerase FklB
MKLLPVVFVLCGLLQSVFLFGQTDTISYSVGMSVGARMANQGANNIDYEDFLRGVRDMIEKNETLITKAVSDSINYNYYQEQKDKIFTEVKEEGIKFLEDNAKRPEVATTESGLQYEVLTAAEGTKPSAKSSVTVHYVGQLISGEMFDSSVDRGEPATFPLNRVIPGWTEGVQLMSEGAKYRFYIPYELGYGARGAGAAIPPYSALIFDVELLKIN